MENMEEDYVRGVLGQIGLDLVKSNYTLCRPDGSAECEVDLVYTHKGCTFVIEVSANAQRDARRRKRKAIGEWSDGDSFARLSSALGLPVSNTLRAVYVDLSWHVEGGEDPSTINGGLVLGDAHMEELEAGPPDRSLSVFLEWNGL